MSTSATSSRSSLKMTIADPSNKPLERRDSARRSVVWKDEIAEADGKDKGKLAEVRVFEVLTPQKDTPQKIASQDSIAQAASPPDQYEEPPRQELPRVRNRLGWLRAILPNCLYDLICWLFCLSDEPVSESPQIDIMIGSPDRAQAVPVAQDRPVEMPLVHLEQWIQTISNKWKESGNKQSAKITRTSNKKLFHGCKTILLVKIDPLRGNPVFFTHNKFYDAAAYENFPSEIEEFYRARLSTLKNISAYETLLMRICPNPQMPNSLMTYGDSSSFEIGDLQPKNADSSCLYNSGLKNDILRKFPLLNEGNVSVADLTP